MPTRRPSDEFVPEDLDSNDHLEAIDNGAGLLGSLLVLAIERAVALQLAEEHVCVVVPPDAVVFGHR